MLWRSNNEPTMRNWKATLTSSKMMAIEEKSREVALLPASASAFRLPKGWKVEQVPRPSYPSQIDKYYHEPGTGRKFRSLVSVERYMRGEDLVPHTNSKKLTVKYRKSSNRRMIISNGRMVRLNEKQMTVVSCAKISQYGLPDGWVVEHAPRRDGRIDRYYYEPGTGRRFRSQIAALRHLAELDEARPLSNAVRVIEENVPLSRMFKLNWHRKAAPSWKKKMRRDDTDNSSFLKPPAKVNWVIASTQGDIWNAFIGESLVPDSVKKQWNKRLMLFMNDGGCEEEEEEEKEEDCVLKC